jgi:hypothetical protein
VHPALAAEGCLAVKLLRWQMTQAGEKHYLQVLLVFGFADQKEALASCHPPWLSHE